MNSPWMTITPSQSWAQELEEAIGIDFGRNKAWPPAVAVFPQRLILPLAAVELPRQKLDHPLAATVAFVLLGLRGGIGVEDKRGEVDELGRFAYKVDVCAGSFGLIDRCN